MGVAISMVFVGSFVGICFVVTDYICCILKEFVLGQFAVLPTLFTAIIGFKAWRYFRQNAREEYIRSFAFPKGIFAKVIEKYPHLSQKDMELVANGLRQFFLAYLKSSHKFVSMPSQVADELWHELILYTKEYQSFCQKSFGKFLHHSPAVMLKSKDKSNAGLRRCWLYACREENINPRQPTRLPLLFALDAKFQIQDGFFYFANCEGVRRAGTNTGNIINCGSDFSDSTVNGGLDGFDSDGGSDGGDGCGGGCGGD